MDFTTTIYDSTAQDNYYPASKADSVVSADQLCTFMTQLLSTMALPSLCAAYFRQLEQLLPVSALDLSDFDEDLMMGTPFKPGDISVELALPDNCQNNDEDTRCARYSLARTLDNERYTWLLQLHQLFSQQFANLLEHERIRQAATKDMLTGLGNRNGFDEALTRMIGRAQRHQQSFALLIIDLDNFKHVNDTLGHREGDAVLINVANQIRHSLRNEDEAFRFGGDEFCCLIDCQTLSQLNAAADRLQALIRQSPYLRRHNISCSLGGAVFRDGDDQNMLFDRADAALYDVKQTGKNSYQAA
ncbi:GGDEF domain-containing protein [Alteromonas sp. CYL-A6]|uniref:GGDEF domain-containing protein n=1 Tax=Alteromonas nitratireducens TaxID=3390813 RepID=UPI0034B628A1